MVLFHHQQTRMHWPKRYTELFCMVFFICMVFILFLFEILIIRPYLVEKNNPNVPFHLFAALFILFNTCSSFYKVIQTDTSIIGIVMPSKLLPKWRYCYVCESNAPPRSYHCSTCDRCILRRDHHCIFTACCIGYKNYKYYMGLLFQVALACIYASIMHWPYVWSQMHHLSLVKAFFAHCMPLGFFLFGVINSWTMFCNVISMLCIIGALFSIGLLFYHFNLLLNNQTTYERAKSIKDYRLKSWKHNLQAILGNRWPLTVFLTPFIDSQLPGDGLYFPTNEYLYKQS